MPKRNPLVCQHLENIPATELEESQDIISQYVRNQQGVYALYRRDEIYYVGRASNLHIRLGQHMKDHHHDLWDRFSVYITIGNSHLHELESLILRIVKPKPPGNIKTGKFANSEDLRRRFRRDWMADISLKRDYIFGKQHEFGKSSRSGAKPARPLPRPPTAGLVDFIYELKQKGKTLAEVTDIGQKGKYAGLPPCYFKDRWSKTPPSAKADKPINSKNKTIAKMTGQGAILVCAMKNVEARGYRTSDGFVVLKDSTAVLRERGSASKWPSSVAKRKRLIADGTLVEKDDFYEFTSSSMFSSPSEAAQVIHGGPANGLTAWKTQDGTTLKELDALPSK